MDNVYTLIALCGVSVYNIKKQLARELSPIQIAGADYQISLELIL